jgi:hypothetical protein
MIINAPAGATAAELGGGVTQSTTNSTNTTLDSATNDLINNNINANATSGNADVSSNTSGGSATSGNADTAVNLLNVENSDLSLSGWFGILFINVFGTWNGSFGSSTYFADLDAANSASGNSGSNSTVAAPMQVFRFLPKTGSSTSSSDPSSGGSANGGSTTDSSSNNGIEAILTSDHARNVANGAPTPKLQAATRGSLLLPILGVIAFVLYVIGDRLNTIRSRRLVNKV